MTGYLFALGATVIWSGNFIAARALYETVSPGTLSFLRWSTAALTLLPLAAPALKRERRNIRRHLGYLLLTAFLGVTLFSVLLYEAACSTSVLNLSLIATSSPVFTLLLARVFLGERLTGKRVAGLAVTVFGVFILLTGGDLSLLLNLHFSIGDLWMLLAAAIFGAYTILVRRKPQHLSQATFLLTTFALGSVLLMPWVLREALHHGLPHPSIPLLSAVLYIGVGASVVAYFLWNEAVACIGPTQCGFIYYTLPVFSGAEAFLLLGEPVGWVHAVSCLLILGGIVLATRT